MVQTFFLKILRGIAKRQYWDTFELECKPFYNITSALMDIQKRPVNTTGSLVTPVAWEQGCLEEVCGACSMLINGHPRQACTALIEPMLKNKLGQTITLAPLTKFPLIRDLVVDRSSMFHSLRKVRAWIDADDSYNRGVEYKIAQEVQEVHYILATCMSCGCCTEACPQVSSRSKFIGPAPISQVRLFNGHPIGRLQAASRLRPLMEEGGIADCGNAQNCARVCPKHIPLTESIALIGRRVTGQAIKDFFSLPDA
jgi:succinate dehydrogenase / fumarate reductase iron-sulfur subunit